MRRDVSNVDPTEADELFKREGYFVEDVLSQVDPPRHTPFRRLVEKLFTGPTVKRMHGYLDTHVVELIDTFADRGRADFYHEFAVPLPVDVIADQLGLPRSDGMKLKRWTDAFIASFDATITAERKLECVKGILEFQKYFVTKRDEKLAQPGDDLLSMLVAARKDDGAPLTIEEYLALCAQLMVAGNETTRNVLLAGLHELVNRAGAANTLKTIAGFDPAIRRRDVATRGAGARIVSSLHPGGDARRRDAAGGCESFATVRRRQSGPAGVSEAGRGRTRSAER
jgi:cytochrome P450